MGITSEHTSDSVRARLIKAAIDCFLAYEYHDVTTRMIAKRANVNASMIRYYFGSKEGLYEEMIRENWTPWLDVLDSPIWSSAEGFAEYLRLFYDSSMFERLKFSKLIMKVLGMNQGPGRRLMLQLLERGRVQSAKIVDNLKAHGQISPSVDGNALWVVFVSLTLTPILFKDIFEEQMGRAIDIAFLESLADFNHRLFAGGLAPATYETVSKYIM